MDEKESNHVKIENQNIDMTLDEITDSYQSGDTLIIDVSNGSAGQTDRLFDKLIMEGFQVEKSFKNNKTKVLVINRIH